MRAVRFISAFCFIGRLSRPFRVRRADARTVDWLFVPMLFPLAGRQRCRLRRHFPLFISLRRIPQMRYINATRRAGFTLCCRVRSLRPKMHIMRRKAMREARDGFARMGDLHAPIMKPAAAAYMRSLFEGISASLMAMMPIFLRCCYV